MKIFENSLKFHLSLVSITLSNLFLGNAQLKILFTEKITHLTLITKFSKTPKKLITVNLMEFLNIKQFITARYLEENL
jgi:hypothetical protein